jgi:hypothetical protein
MAIKAINFKFNGTTTSISSYDSTLTNLGPLIKQYSGLTADSIFAGPAIIGLARPIEQSTSISAINPHIIPFSSNIDYVYLCDGSAAAATRKITLYTFNKTTSVFNWLGFVTLTYPTATNHTIKGFRVSRNLYTTSTVSVSNTAVTGAASTWLTDKMSVGCRIGFGSTDPTAITTWYEIGAVVSNTSITLTTSASTFAAGTPYVIEDIILVTSTSNATTTNGGLFITKGIRPEIFTNGGTTIPAATTIDNIRAVYWLADASTVTNTVACGSAIQAKTSWIAQNVYVLDATGPKLYVYNIRAALTLVAGKSTNNLVLTTGSEAATGTISQSNNGRIGILYHGPASGVESLYFVTTTRVYRVNLSALSNASVTWQTDVMIEVPPGGVSTYLLTSSLSSCEIASDIDRLVVVSTGVNSSRSYVTQYNTISNPFDHIFLNDDKQLDQSSADSGGVPHPSILTSAMSIWAEAGVLYLARIGTTAAVNQIYTLPIGAHQTYAFNNNELLITPKFDVSDSNKLYSVAIKSLNRLGTDTFSLPTEPYKVYYRTSGIDDNTGSWALLDVFGDLSSITATVIQFAFIFKILGTTCIPARILGLTLSYEDTNTDSHYQPSVGASSIANRQFGYRQSTAWNSLIPNLRIRLYNATTGALVLDDNVISSTLGVFKYSTDGGTTWLTWSSSADAVGNYIDYTATSLPNGINIKAILTQA